MPELSIFISVGSKATDQQKEFIQAVQDRLRREGLIPHALGINSWSSDAPLKAVNELMDGCSGAVIIALERTFFPSGVEKIGGRKEATLTDIKLPTPWNQVEAALAYSRGFPLLVIVEEGLRREGLLEPGYDWYVQSVAPVPAALNSREFNGVLASWKEKVVKRQKEKPVAKSAAELSVAELVGGLKVTQFWSLLVALVALLGGSFALGAKLFGAH